MDDLVKKIQFLVKKRETDSTERIFNLIERFDNIVAEDGIDEANKINARRFMCFSDERALGFYNIYIGEKTRLYTVIRKAKSRIKYNEIKKQKEIEENNYKNWVHENEKKIEYFIRFLKENKLIE